MAVQIRGFADEDLSGLVELLNDARGGSYEFIPLDEDKLSSRIREWNLEILVAEEEGAIVGSVAYNNGHWGEEIEWLCVLDRLGLELENLLVREIEKCVKGETGFAVVDAESSKINDWVERGYKPKGGLCHMVATLDGLRPFPKVPEGVVIRSLISGEEREFVDAVDAGFGWERLKQGAIQKWKSECPPFSQEWVHIAELDDEIVSVVVSRPNMEYNESFGGNRGYLGPAATLPQYRGKNLASALTCRAMNLLFRKGMDSVALYTSEQNLPAISLLQKIDFRIGHHWKFMRKSMP